MTPEEQLIQRYFDAFNRHDIDGVMACYHEEPVLVSSGGKRCTGRAEVRKSYETEFATFPDAHCALRVCTGNNGHGVAESFFSGTRAERGRVEAIGAEVMEIVDGKIKEIRDYHQLVPARAAQEPTTSGAAAEYARRTQLCRAYDARCDRMSDFRRDQSICAQGFRATC